MTRSHLIGAAALALAACGAEQGGNAVEANAAANLVDTLPNELADESVSDANLANAAETGAPAPATPAVVPQPRARPPAPKAAPPPQPRRALPTKAETEPDPHAGHDMNDMSQD